MKCCRKIIVANVTVNDPLFVERTRDKKEPMSGAGTPTQDSNHGDVDMRLTTTSQSIQSVVSAGGKTADGTANSGTALLPGVFHGKRRCRDFDGNVTLQ
jgi:RNA-binding protein 26